MILSGFVSVQEPSIFEMEQNTYETSLYSGLMYISSISDLY